MKIALLIDHAKLTRWQAEALDQLGTETEFLIYNCTNARPGRRRLRYAPYYLLNLISLRSDRTRQVPLPIAIATNPILDFECEQDGAWQKLPDALIEQIRQDRPVLIVKFGMGLLKVPDPDRLPIPILSYHHGDPRRFRGRPAGFYELLQGDQIVGQVVQILSNRLDSGRVVAYAETKVHRHSYRATMCEAYAVSPLLLPQAVRAVLEGRTLEISPAGKAYRLPPPLTVLRFALQRSSSKFRRLAYGMFVEKAWQVAEAPRLQPEAFPSSPFPPRAAWRKLDQPRGYRFLADPFYHPDGDGILVEAMRSSTGLGEVLHMSAKGVRPLLAGPGHYSYPATHSEGGTSFLVPEVCEWSRPKLYRLNEAAQEVGELKLPRSCRLIDPTLFERDRTIFLFANLASEGAGVLRLWTAPSLMAPFEEHPQSPLLISPAGARMGGAIIEQDGDLYRVGQDGRDQYGDGVIAFRIEELSPLIYRETEIDRLRFKERRGPHTLNFNSDSALFDYYQQRFSLTAGLRRLRARWHLRPEPVSTAHPAAIRS